MRLRQGQIRQRWGALGALVLCAGAIARQGGAYQIAPIPPPPGAQYGQATAVNNFGIVVGRWFYPLEGVYHGFTYNVLTRQVTDLGALGPGDEHGLWGVNDGGAIVGTMLGVDGLDHAILIGPDATTTDITKKTTNFAPAGGAEARAINAAGAIAGVSAFDCSFVASAPLGCRWSPGGFFVTPLFGTNNLCSPTRALSVNDSGVLAGWAQMNMGTTLTPAIVIRPFLSEDNGQTPLPTFSSPLETGMACSVGGAGDACGVAQDLTDSGNVWPALWTRGTIVKLQAPGGGFVNGSAALGVNSSRIVVGRTGDATTGQATVWLGNGNSPYQLSTLTSPVQPAHPDGWQFVTARAVSDAGFIVGDGLAPGDTSGNSMPYLLIPCVPVVIQSPPPQTSCFLGTLMLDVEAVGAGTLTYQWMRGDSALQNIVEPSGARISGVQTNLLKITGFDFADEGDYSVVITGSCGSVQMPAIHISVCRADLSCDGFVTDSDFVIFAAAYDILDCADPSMPFRCPADLNNDGVVDDADFLVFVQAYNAVFCQ
jgi:uncharacterized membrane protein